MKGNRFFTTFCLAVILGATPSAWAVPTIAVDESGVEGKYTITCKDLECQNTGTFLFTEGFSVHVVIPILPILATPLSGSVNFREANGSVSDVVFISSNGLGSVVIDFVSDSDTGFPVLDPVPGPFVLETGHPLEVTTGTLSDGQTLHITFASDPDPVPEPSTWLLLATGCLGLLGYRWRQRKKAA